MAFSNARKTKCNQGHIHDSGAEARRCDSLTLQQKAGLISGLTQQPKCVLAYCVKYTADFLYIENGIEIWHDEKGREDRGFVKVRQLWKYWGPGVLRLTAEKKKTREIVPQPPETEKKWPQNK